MDAMELRQGAEVVADDGTLGRLRHVVVGDETREAAELVVADGAAEWLVPASAVAHASDRRITLRGTAAEYRAVGFQPDQYHIVDEDEVRDETERRADRGGRRLLHAREAEATVGDGGRHRTGTGERGDASPYRIRLREERLRVATEREQAGEVHLAKRVVEHTETADVPVVEERVVIERRPMGHVPAAVAGIGDGATIEVSVMRERAVAEKEAVVVEEVAVRKETVERTERVEATLKKEELVTEGAEELIANPNAVRATDYERESTSRA